MLVLQHQVRNIKELRKMSRHANNDTEIVGKLEENLIVLPCIFFWGAMLFIFIL